MDYLFEQGYDSIHSDSYRTTREALTSKLEMEAVKKLSKTRL